MKRIALSLALLLFILSVTTVQSLEQSGNTISSYGIVNSATHKLSWGVAISNTAWGYDYWGNMFGQTQINVIKEAGATSIRIMLDKYAWDLPSYANKLKIAYPDYIKQLVTWCKPELYVYLDLVRDSSMGEFVAPEKKQVIENTDGRRTAWINWGKAVIAYCNPDAIGIMTEPAGVTFDYYYDNFVTPSINAYRSVDPDIGIFVMGMPFYSLDGFKTRPINDDNVFYEFHHYFKYQCNPNEVSKVYYDMIQAYKAGNYETGKALLYQYFDWKFSGLPKGRINFGEDGIYGLSTEDPNDIDPSWDEAMVDTYDYAKENQLHGLHQYGVGPLLYKMLSSTTGYTTFTPYGELWAQNCPV